MSLYNWNAFVKDVKQDVRQLSKVTKGNVNTDNILLSGLQSIVGV